jgi:hypothetical protein
VSLWQEMLSRNAALAEVADEFGGEDVLNPLTRGDLDKVRRGLEEAHEFMHWMVGEIELPELDPENLAQVRQYILYFAEKA